MKGLFVEVASIAALILGVYGAIHFSDFAASFLMERVDWNENYVNITAFAITFIAIVIVIALAGKALTKIADFASLGILNKLLGGLFGALKVGLIRWLFGFNNQINGKGTDLGIGIRAEHDGNACGTRMEARVFKRDAGRKTLGPEF